MARKQRAPKPGKLTVPKDVLLKALAFDFIVLLVRRITAEAMDQEQRTKDRKKTGKGKR